MNLEESLTVVDLLVRERERVLAILEGPARAELHRLLGSLDSTNDKDALLRDVAAVVMAAGAGASSGSATSRGVTADDIEEALQKRSTLAPRVDQMLNGLQSVRQRLEEILGPQAADSDGKEKRR